ncbi:glycosyltransferase [Terrisporobacter glycolicus]|uniref:N-acetylgalactosamine-N, N'-diacetylbacillosaminyl-diphospho-undecaprenol 4-alpha-N-acetylgalactosaminyltransferase n=1 Tax=Terrisporobacter glycolicus ATCC 14880 = DSM 1288 TaxID=1121315 RepID=A0ABZ2ET10_9FIRM|nr:glycosyltransferase [Terrisporobacter glycolicus]
MKKILFVCYGLGIGGIEKCLVSLLNELDLNKYEIDVLPMNPEFELKNQIRDDINILNTFEYAINTKDTFSQYIKEKNKFLKVFKISKYIVFRLVNKFGSKPWKLFKSPNKSYDIAIAYSQNDFSPYYVIDKVNAKIKYMWYHNGAYEKGNKQYEIDKQYYPKFANMVAVSKDCKKQLVMRFPQLKDKILILHNIINKQEIINLSEKVQYEIFHENTINIVSVGRLTEEKGGKLAIEVCRKLLDEGYNIKWYWVGNGNQFPWLSDKIKKMNMRDTFYLLGNKTNPYTYIKNCDIYVQPSYYEAYCTTTNEARILNKPVVATNVGGMKEQFINGKTGILVDIDKNSIFNAIKLLIDNDECRLQLSFNLKNIEYEFDNYINEYDNLFTERHG